jgi:hypothetical protein
LEKKTGGRLGRTFRHTHFAVNFHENNLFPINFHHDRIGISLLKRLISLSDFDGPARE